MTAIDWKMMAHNIAYAQNIKEMPIIGGIAQMDGMGRPLLSTHSHTCVFARLERCLIFFIFIFKVLIVVRKHEVVRTKTRWRREARVCTHHS